jgi:hypothetical protein
VPVDLANLTQKQFKELTARANAGDRDALAELREILDASPAIWHKLGNVALQSEAALLDLACNGNQAVRESIRRQIQDMREQLGSETGDQLIKMGIDRVVLCWLQLHVAERNLANAAPGSALARHWHKTQQQAASMHAAAVKSLLTIQQFAEI